MKLSTYKNSITTKVICGFGTLCVVVVLLACKNYIDSDAEISALKELQKINDRRSNLSTASDKIDEATLSIRQYLITGDAQELNKYEANISEANNHLKRAVELASPDKKERAERMLQLLEEYRYKMQIITIPYAQRYHEAYNTGDFAQSAELRKKSVDIFRIELYPIINELRERLATASASSEQKTAEQLNDNIIAEQNSKVVFGLAGLLVVWLSIMITYYISSKIKEYSEQVVQFMDKYAAGDLSHNIRPDKLGEFGDIANSIIKAKENLAEMITQIANSSQQVVAAVQQLSASAEQSAEIANQVATSINSSVGDRATEENVIQLYPQSDNIPNDKFLITAEQLARIVDLMNSLAGTANMLALNASMDAIRGDVSQHTILGMSKDIKILSDRLRNAATEVVNIIAATNQKIAIIDNSLSPGAIMSLTNILDRTTLQIKAASSKMETITQVKTEELNNIQTAAIAQEQSASLQEIAASSQNLSKLTEDLNNSISKFKIR